MAFLFGGSDDKDDASLDPDEAVLSLQRGPNSQPWHPNEMKPPYIYKLCLLGQTSSGKSSIAHRLVTHTFEPTYRPTRNPAQLFWRHTEPATGNDIMIEIEDTPGISPATLESGDLAPRAQAEADALLKPLVWFEKLRREKDTGRRAAQADEGTPLCSGDGGGGPQKRGKKGGGKGGGGGGGAAGKDGGGGGFAAKAGEAFASAFAGASEGRRSNPIGEDRKRMAFVIVADVSSAHSFTVAYAIADRIFDRVQFDVSDPITCPVAILIVGNKSDLRGARRQVEDEGTVRAEIQRRYYNPRAEPQHSVLYAECSAQTNTAIEPAFLEVLQRIRILPSRSRIRSARLRVTGFCAQCKKSLFTICPICFDLEECTRHLHRAFIRPCVKRLGLYAILCECKPLLALLSFIYGIIKKILSFRWLCDWCPPFVLRLRQEVTAEEEDDDLERGAGAGGGGAAEDDE